MEVIQREIEEMQKSSGIAQFIRMIEYNNAVREKFLFGYLQYALWQESDKFIAQYFGSAIGVRTDDTAESVGESGNALPLETNESNLVDDQLEQNMPRTSEY